LPVAVERQYDGLAQYVIQEFFVNRERDRGRQSAHASRFTHSGFGVCYLLIGTLQVSMEFVIFGPTV
jgi:hypothetical protein